MIYAVQMIEYNRGQGYLRRRWMSAKWGEQFVAGDSTPKRKFIPSKVVEVEKEQYDYLTGKDANGNPLVHQPRNSSLPVFRGFMFKTRLELVGMTQNDADRRASQGGTSARAVPELLGPLEPVQAVIQKEPVEKVADEEPEDFEPMNVQEALDSMDTPDDREPDEKEEAPKSRRRGRPKKTD